MTLIRDPWWGKDWIPGQARNDAGLGLGGGLWAILLVWIPGQARNDVGLGLGSGLWAIPPGLDSGSGPE